MWRIGIKSGLIIVLGFIAYGLVIQFMGLQRLPWNNLYYVVLILGIYFGHYCYKEANNGLMTYQQGIKLGLISNAFVGLVNACPIYLYTKFVDASLISQLAQSVQESLRQKGIEEASIGEIAQTIQRMSPEVLAIGVLVSTVLLGFAFALVIAVFSKSSKKTTSS
ncbi:MAG: DUF4199 domain-containing protein [Amoebophilaceae bacterium]|jgi:hypothetical protein|nr:DUF4199 domain-containing protein [Amoebophilaceae bacterium]